MPKTPDAHIEMLLKAELHNVPYADIAHEYGYTVSGVRGMVSRARNATDGKAALWNASKASTTPNALGLKAHLSPNLPPIPCIQIAPNSTVVAGDVHVTTTNYDMLDRMLQVASRYLSPPRTFILGGDLFNQDAFSGYDPLDPVGSFEAELTAARAFMNIILSVFDDVWMISGNHDRRATKRTGGQISMAMLQRLIMDTDRFHLSPFAYMQATMQTPSGDETYHISHPRSYSRIQLRTANLLSGKHETHVISHHEHHLARGWSDNGRYILINNGGLFNQQAMGYVMLEDSTMPTMKNGFTAFIDDVPELFGEYPFTNWQRWLG